MLFLQHFATGFEHLIALGETFFVCNINNRLLFLDGIVRQISIQ